MEVGKGERAYPIEKLAEMAYFSNRQIHFSLQIFYFFSPQEKAQSLRLHIQSVPLPSPPLALLSTQLGQPGSKLEQALSKSINKKGELQMQLWITRRMHSIQPLEELLIERRFSYFRTIFSTKTYTCTRLPLLELELPLLELESIIGVVFSYL